MTGPRIKGAVVREFLRWYAQRSPSGALRQIWDDLPPDAQRAFDPGAEALGVLPSTWYDCSSVHALVDAMERAVPVATREAVLRDGTRAGVHASSRGIYRWVIGKLTPDLYARNIQRLWNMMHDTGTREIVLTSPESATSTTRDWRGHHPVVCFTTMEAMAAVLEVMGCKNVVAQRIACVSDGAAACVAHVTWSR